MKPSIDVEQAIREYLPEVLHMSLATCAGSTPWVFEVHYVYDEDLNLYFRSKPERRHSMEIAQSPNVAGNIVTQHKMGEKPRAVYFEGKAAMLSGVTDEQHPVYQLFRDRFGMGPEILEDAQQNGGHQFYMITVADYYIFDARESAPGQKYHLGRTDA